jgi:hypothetical protein
VDNNSLTCPKCFKEIPRDVPTASEPRSEDTRSNPNNAGRKINRSVTLVLAVIPALFGLLGLGQIYSNPNNLKGFKLLGLGLIIFIPFAFLFLTLINSDNGILSAFLIFLVDLVLFLVYVGVAAYSFLDAVFGSFLRVFGV